ncbi:3-oxoacyl-[acyl-carrier-protein] synthase II [Cytobacillus purgationiresistens]|uniref:3-oxoacyl-[acyl-carrier-protein] synthase II n=2 Tax=Cytobacillus purgationiresistens TaxID=863449 RepID=A0ABU0AH17_9BACI|nr:3-oxoacyl-[acyl-carrier-protein] synthase II [Cytobacillus purgationiresistens]
MGVVITGMGIIGPGFTSIESYTNILKTGTSVLKREKMKNKFIHTGRVQSEEMNLTFEKGNRYPKSAKMLLHASEMAVQMARVTPRDYKTAVIIGSSGGVISEVANHTSEMETGKRLGPYAIGNMNANTLSSSINAQYHLNGMSFTLANSCTSGMDALHLAKILIRSKEVDLCIVGGVDATVNDLVLQSFLPLRVLQTGETLSGPFSGGEGFAMSEGAGVLIVEDEKSALNRGADILGVVKATSITQDARSPFLSDSLGGAMLKAADECIGTSMPSYINSQALGIEENDAIEAMVYERKFTGSSIPITSIKGMVGHAMGASGTFQIIASLISLKEQFIPPTIHSNPTKYKNLPIIREKMDAPVESVFITTHGYGGNNGCAWIS